MEIESYEKRCVAHRREGMAIHWAFLRRSGCVGSLLLVIDSGGLGLEALEELVYNVRLQRRCNRKASLEPKVVSCFKMRFGAHHH